MLLRCTALVAIVLMAAACSRPGDGGSAGPPLSHHQYSLALQRLDVSPAAKQAERLFFKLAAGQVTPAQCTAGARQFSDDVARVIDQAGRLSPPADVAQLQDQFVDAATTSSDAIAQAAADVESGDLKCGQPWNRRVYGLQSTNQAVAALAGMAARGILFDGNNSH